MMKSRRLALVGLAAVTVLAATYAMVKPPVIPATTAPGAKPVMTLADVASVIQGTIGKDKTAEQRQAAFIGLKGREVQGTMTVSDVAAEDGVNVWVYGKAPEIPSIAICLPLADPLLAEPLKLSKGDRVSFVGKIGDVYIGKIEDMDAGKTAGVFDSIHVVVEDARTPPAPGAKPVMTLADVGMVIRGVMAKDPTMLQKQAAFMELRGREVQGTMTVENVILVQTGGNMWAVYGNTLDVPEIPVIRIELLKEDALKLSKGKHVSFIGKIAKVTDNYNSIIVENARIQP